MGLGDLVEAGCGFLGLLLLGQLGLAGLGDPRGLRIKPAKVLDQAIGDGGTLARGLGLDVKGQGIVNAGVRLKGERGGSQIDLGKDRGAVLGQGNLGRVGAQSGQVHQAAHTCDPLLVLCHGLQGLAALLAGLGAIALGGDGLGDTLVA